MKRALSSLLSDLRNCTKGRFGAFFASHFFAFRTSSESCVEESCTNRPQDSKTSPGAFFISEAQASNDPSPCAATPREKHTTPAKTNPASTAVKTAAFHAPRLPFDRALIL